MKGKSLLIALLFTTLLLNTWTAFAQPPSSDTARVIPYTEAMDRACIECWINAPRKDSIILELKQFSSYQDSIIFQQQESLSKAKKRTRNTAIISGTGSGIIGILFGWLFASIAK